MTKKIVLEINASASENAGRMFAESKKGRAKLAGLAVAEKETLARLESLEYRKSVPAMRLSAPAAPRRPREWFERFHHFITSGGRLAIGGRGATDNEFLVRKHLGDSDLFFHADVTGGSVVVLKDGIHAGEQEKMEAAQFAAIFSRAWKAGLLAADAYCVTRSQVGTTSTGEFVAHGGFVLSGKRTWFKNIELKLAIGSLEGRLALFPSVHASLPARRMFLTPGLKERVELAHIIHKKLGSATTFSVESVAQALPGPGELVER